MSCHNSVNRVIKSYILIVISISSVTLDVSKEFKIKAVTFHLRSMQGNFIFTKKSWQYILLSLEWFIFPFSLAYQNVVQNKFNCAVPSNWTNATSSLCLMLESSCSHSTEGNFFYRRCIVLTVSYF